MKINLPSYFKPKKTEFNYPNTFDQPNNPNHNDLEIQFNEN